MAGRLAAVALAASLALPAIGWAQPAAPFDPEVAPPKEILRLSGGWKIATEDGVHSCRITLTARRIPAGYVVVQPTPCTDPVLYMDEVVAWTITPNELHLLTVTGAVASRFFPDNARLLTRTDPVLVLTSTDKDGEGTL